MQAPTICSTVPWDAGRGDTSNGIVGCRASITGERWIAGDVRACVCVCVVEEGGIGGVGYWGVRAGESQGVEGGWGEGRCCAFVFA